MMMDELLGYIAAAAIIAGLIILNLYLNARVRRAESLEEQIAKDKQITDTYRWIRDGILENDQAMKILKNYDKKNGTNYEEFLRETFDVIDSFMENRDNDLIGYLMLAINRVPKVLEILRLVNLMPPKTG